MRGARAAARRALDARLERARLRARGARAVRGRGLSWDLAGWALERPWGALALLAPLALLVLWSVPREPAQHWLGSFALWEQSVPEEGSARRRRRVPLWLALALLGLTLGACALAGPRRLRAPELPPLRVLLDRSPSMHLPVDPAAVRPTRLEAALAQLRQRPELGTRTLVWVLDDGTQRADAGLREPPAEWHTAPRAPAAEIELLQHEAPDLVLVTDRAPQVPHARAGWSASGGMLVPGPIGDELTDGSVHALEWNGTHVERGARLEPLLALVRGDEALPEPIEQLLRAWTEVRGLQLERVAAPSAAQLERACLSVHAASGAASSAPSADELDARCERDGFAARVRSRGAPREPRAGREAWLRELGSERVLLERAPGELWLHFDRCEFEPGDPARAAVAFARLFDETALPRRGAVSIEERAEAGPAAWRAPALLKGGGSIASARSFDARAGARLDALLASAAALALCAAFALRARG